MKDNVAAMRKYRDLMMSDPYRPAYHFAIPDGDGMPGDPNGAFFADGRYHLMYLYKSAVTGGYHWGHISSHDLLHWRLHPDALAASPEHKGYFSGGAFVDDDKTAYLTYWKLPYNEPGVDAGGIAVARSKPPYDEWEELEPIAVPATVSGISDLEKDGETLHLACADPSNIWKSHGYYYMQAGNKPTMDKYGHGENAPQKYRGDWTDLFRSKDMKKWEPAGRFYENTHSSEDWPNLTEDDMCPSFLPIYDAKSGGKPTGKWLQLFISHNKGCQYYVGTLSGETFVPEVHGRMTWRDNIFFAPEALVDDKNRHIMWAWLLDTPADVFAKYGWRGVYSFPRALWWQDGTLHMAPVEELDRLQYNRQVFEGCLPGEKLPVLNGASFRLKAVWNGGAGFEKAGFRVRVSEDGGEYAEIYVDTKAKKLVFDTTNSLETGRNRHEEAPFELKEGEKLSLDIFVDRSVVEVYANERQAVCRRIFLTDPEKSLGVVMIGDAAPDKTEAWEMDPANLY